jgi:hypothetical protein
MVMSCGARTEPEAIASPYPQAENLPFSIEKIKASVYVDGLILVKNSACSCVQYISTNHINPSATSLTALLSLHQFRIIFDHDRDSVLLLQSLL